MKVRLVFEAEVAMDKMQGTTISDHLSWMSTYPIDFIEGDEVSHSVEYQDENGKWISPTNELKKMEEVVKQMAEAQKKMDESPASKTALNELAAESQRLGIE